jgi:hypothetical protein
VLRSAHAAAKSSMWMVPPCRSASCHPRSILCRCCGEPGSGILASCPSGRQHAHIHTHSRIENRPPHAPRPAHVHIPDDGSAVAHAANDGPTRRPQPRARSFVSPNGVNRMSSPDFKCLNRVNGERGYHRIRDLTSLNFHNCCTEVCLRDLPSLEKHAANA